MFKNNDSLIYLDRKNTHKTKSHIVLCGTEGEGRPPSEITTQLSPDEYKIIKVNLFEETNDNDDELIEHASKDSFSF